MTLGRALVVGLVLLAAGTAAAKDTPQSVLDDAKILARSGDQPMKAAERFGDAVAMAQAAGDLKAEEAATDAMEEFISDATRDAGRAKAEGGKTTDVPSQASLLAAVMVKLDANRCGAFVSAPVLARNVLRLATEAGSSAGVADAARVAAAHATKSGSGRAAAVVAKYAEGMKAAADSKFDAAAVTLSAVAADAAKAGWLDLAAHAGTESAASWVRAGQPDKATEVMTAVAAAFGPSASHAKVGDWQTYANRRLADAPETVRKPLADLAAGLKGGNSASAAGGRGGRGGSASSASGPPMSDIAKFLLHLPKGKPFVSAQRTAEGIEAHWTTSNKKPCTPSDDTVHIVDEGGVTLAIHDRSVALRMLDMEGGRGQPGEASGNGVTPLGRAFYLLALGETWSVSKDGVVTITH